MNHVRWWRVTFQQTTWRWGEDLYSVIAAKVWKVPKVRPLKITRNCPRLDCLLVSSWGLSPKLMYILSAAATAESIFSSTCMCMCIVDRDRIHIVSCFSLLNIIELTCINCCIKVEVTSIRIFLPSRRRKTLPQLVLRLEILKSIKKKENYETNCICVFVSNISYM